MSPSTVHSFDSRQYWDTRFRRSPDPFEWLQPPSILSRTLPTILSSLPSPSDANILHIGCGTSDLSFWLRSYVSKGSQIHNVDFSSQAVVAGRARETDVFGDTTRPDDRMRWDVVDLLDWSAFGTVLGKLVRRYDVIVDKSTADAIACGEDRVLASPLRRGAVASEEPIKIDAVSVLALHLAAVTESHARWVVLSYSADRFSFLDQSPSHKLPDGTAAPSHFWTLERHEEIPERSLDQTGGPVHRPVVTHHLYILARRQTL